MNIMIYHNTYTAAIQTAIDAALAKGYETDDDNRYMEIGCGRGKPSEGQSTRHTLDLYKDGVLVKNRNLYIQVYGMSLSYELNYYIQ